MMCVPDTHFRTPGLPSGTLWAQILDPRGSWGSPWSSTWVAIRIRALFSLPKVAKVLRICSGLNKALYTEIGNFSPDP